LNEPAKRAADSDAVQFESFHSHRGFSPVFTAGKENETVSNGFLLKRDNLTRRAKASA
jgi:hypothetical protein